MKAFNQGCRFLSGKNGIVFLAMAFSLGIEASCSNDSLTTIIEETTEFHHGFESPAGTLDSLFSGDASAWTDLQLVHPATGPQNRMALSSRRVHSGKYALEIIAHPSDTVVSKADIVKSGFQMFAGNRVVITAWFYIEGTPNLQSVFLLDLECIKCWDPSVPNNQAPGVRLQFSGGDDYLVVERGKIGLRGESFRQNSFRFPRDRWVEIKWLLELSPNEDGRANLYFDGQQILTATGMNMPNAEVFARLAEQEGIKFELQEPVYYERIQIGVTANSGVDSVHVYVDDVSVIVTN